MKQKAMVLFLAVLLLGAFVVGKELGEYASASGEAKGKKGNNTIVVDAGHGGSDPGKVGINGELEKDLNLEIAKKVEKELKDLGFQVIMTRQDDKGLKREGRESGKKEDLRTRVDIINSSKAALAVSIHQNSYNQSDVKGAQVFYYTHSAEGKKAAAQMQEALKGADAQNTRQAKANNSYYMLKRTEVPTIIVECGFLSNPEEAKKLGEEDYQEKIAESIGEGVKRYLEKDEGPGLTP